MEAITNSIQVVGTYLYQVGESAVVGTSNTVVTLGTGVVDVLKAIFTGV